MTTTAAQDEFNDLVSKSAARDTLHPEDRSDPELRATKDYSEEDEYRNGRVEAAMRTPAANDSRGLNLPPASFDNGRSTGVKGVIADARSYENARRSKWKDRINTARRSIFGIEGAAANSAGRAPVSRSGSETTDDDVRSGSETGDENDFDRRWRESRKRELEAEARRGIRNRRTSPSVREFGRLDEVDALGYLDAIEKVGRETTVVVFVYDDEVRDPRPPAYLPYSPGETDQPRNPV